MIAGPRQLRDAGRRFAAALAFSLLFVLALGGAAPREAGAADKTSLGRLFLTPEQRRLLDEQRAHPASRIDSALPKDLLPARTAAGRRVVLNGVVRRASAEPVVWIDGRAAGAAPIAGGRLQVRRGPDAQNRVTLESTGDHAVARLKPGQSWDPVTGRVSDCVQCGALPPPAADAAPAEPSAATPAPVDPAVPAVANASVPAPAATVSPGSP